MQRVATTAAHVYGISGVHCCTTVCLWSRVESSQSRMALKGTPMGSTRSSSADGFPLVCFCVLPPIRSYFAIIIMLVGHVGAISYTGIYLDSSLLCIWEMIGSKAMTRRHPRQEDIQLSGRKTHACGASSVCTPRQAPADFRGSAQAIGFFATSSKEEIVHNIFNHVLLLSSTFFVFFGDIE